MHVEPLAGTAVHFMTDAQNVFLKSGSKHKVSSKRVYYEHGFVFHSAVAKFHLITITKMLYSTILLVG